MDKTIEVDGLTRYFGKHRGIDDVSFDVGEGEIFGFLGPNGAGKTVTIRHLLGFLQPTSGYARILGYDCWKHSRQVKQRVGYLPGDARMYEQMTGMEFLEFFSSFRNFWKQDRVAELIDRLEVETSRRVKYLSRGNRQKLLIIQALMHDSPILVLDEPSSGLDPLKQVEFLDILREERSRGKTIFLSSHQLTEIERIADRVAIIRAGKLVAVEHVNSLIALRERRMVVTFSEPVDPNRLEVLDGISVRQESPSGTYLELAVRGTLAPLLAELSKLPVSDMEYGPAELESVFLHYYGTDEEAPNRLEHPETAVHR
jgi:ABC-2 type transport system ATP-binding protein